MRDPFRHTHRKHHVFRTIRDTVLFATATGLVGVAAALATSQPAPPQVVPSPAAVTAAAAAVTSCTDPAAGDGTIIQSDMREYDVCAGGTWVPATVYTIPGNGVQATCPPNLAGTTAILRVAGTTDMFRARCDRDGPVTVWDATS